MRIWAHSLAAVGALLGAPVVLAGAALRPSWREGWRERLGACPRRKPGAVWVHGASVGEILAAGRLVERLREGGYAVVTSTWTPTGRAVMRRAHPDVPCQLAPIDHPWCVEAALDRVSPRALVLVETELWPSWIAAAARRGIPVLMVSARLSDRSFPRYRRLRPLLAALLRRVRAIGARTETDRERFIALGADPGRVRVSGDLKLDVDDAPPPLATDLDAVLGKVPLVVAGSTHAGEERAALEALAALEDAGLGAGLVIAPRHLDRMRDVIGAVRETGRTLRLRSALDGAPLRPGEVLVLDSLGELAATFSRSRATFVGGTLVPIGGHNVLEPALARRPVVFGPHTANVSHAVEILESCGAGQRVADARELGAAWIELLRDPEVAQARGEAGWQALQRHRGAAERAADLVAEVLTSAADHRPGRGG